MVREIVELGQLNRENSSGLKTHDEILELIGEIKSIEDKLKDPELLKETSTEKVFEKQELEQTEAIEELSDRVQFIEVKTESGLNEKTQREKKKTKKRKIHFPIKIRWMKKPKGVKTGHFLKRIKVPPSGINTPELTELQNQLESSEVGLRPGNTTFTLRIDDQGRLIGYNIKKPKSEGGHRRILSFGKGTTEESGTNEAEEPGIKGKIKSIFSRIKPKQSGESGGSKISILLGKIKGVIPKR